MWERPGMNQWTGEYQSQVSRLASMFSELEAMHKCGGHCGDIIKQSSCVTIDPVNVFFFLLQFICFMKMIVSPPRVAVVQHNKQKRLGSVQPEENGRKSLRRTITLHIFSLIIEKIFQLDESRLSLFRHRLPRSLN